MSEMDSKQMLAELRAIRLLLVALARHTTDDTEAALLASERADTAAQFSLTNEFSAKSESVMGSHTVNAIVGLVGLVLILVGGIVIFSVGVAGWEPSPRELGMNAGSALMFAGSAILLLRIHKRQ